MPLNDYIILNAAPMKNHTEFLIHMVYTSKYQVVAHAYGIFDSGSMVSKIVYRLDITLKRHLWMLGGNEMQPEDCWHQENPLPNIESPKELQPAKHENFNTLLLDGTPVV